MRSSSIPRSLILVASAALTFGACAPAQTDPGGSGAITPAATTAGGPASTSAGTTGSAATAGKPATAGSGTTPTSTGGNTASATAGGPATSAGVAGTTAGSAAAGTGSAGTTAAAAGASGAAGGAAASGGATFTMVHETIFVGTGCAISSCHGSAMAPSKLGLVEKADTYKELVGVKAMGNQPAGSTGTGCMGMDIMRVKKGDPDNSLLVQKLEDTQTCGNTMPPGGMLKADQIKLVRDWIMGGAKND